jgi:hypothetical protein
MFKFIFFSVLSLGLFFATSASATYYCPDGSTPVDGCPTSMDHCNISSTYSKWELLPDGNFTNTGMATCSRDENGVNKDKYKEQQPSSPSSNGQGSI